MDGILFHIERALVYTECYNEINIADFIFENDSDIDREIIKNDNIVSKSIAHIKKAISLIIEQLKKLTSKMKEFLNKTILSGKHKAMINNAKKTLKNNPELASTKVVCPSYKDYEVIYNDTLKSIDKEMNKENSSQESYDKIINEMNKKLDGIKSTGNSIANYAKATPKRAGSAIMLNILVNMADNNYTCAKIINDNIDKEVNILNDLSNTMGEKEVNNFKKKMDKYSKNTIGHRFKLAVLRRQEQTLEDVIKLQTRKILSCTNINRGKFDSNGDRKSLITPDSMLKGAIENPRLTKKILFGPKKKK